MSLEKCVYVIGNKSLKRCYVGETSNINRRLSQHINLLYDGKHYSKALQMDFDKYDVLDAIGYIDCANKTEQERKILEKIVMLSFLKKGWQLYNCNPVPTEKNLELNIIFDLLYSANNEFVISN